MCQVAAPRPTSTQPLAPPASYRPSPSCSLCPPLNPPGPSGSPPAHLHPTSCLTCSTHHPPRPDLPPPPHQACALLHPHPPRRRCVTQPGRRLLRLWFARPIINIGVINDRLDGVEFFLHRPDALDVLRAALRKVGWLL